MGKKIGLLVDTDVLIDYFNFQVFREFLENPAYRIYYSIVTKKELLSKEGLSRSEENAIRAFLKKCRIIHLNQDILDKYTSLRNQFSSLEKEDCLIAATAWSKKLPLFTRNRKHFEFIREIKLL
ncbi:MAG: type II toxin-antitoxin system VapC family toxin [Deltaproteobacteria bacterium]|nr:type II toxin-antitoxin system VapC family toxin [Deltaproteobacteria bacterium]